MKVLVLTKNGLSHSVFEDDESISIEPSRIVVGNPEKLIIGYLGADDVQIYEAVTDVPENWEPNRYLYDGSSWTQVPRWLTDRKVTMRQARLALSQQGLLSAVEDAIALIPDPDKTTISIEWEYSATVERDSPWINTMATALGLSDEQMDDLFKLAATL